MVGLGKSSDVVRSACLCSSWGIDVRNVPLPVWLNQYVRFKLGDSFGHCSLRLDGLGIVDYGESVHGSSVPVTMHLWGLSLYRSVDHILLSVVGAKPKSQKRKLVFVDMSEKSDYERVETQEI